MSFTRVLLLFFGLGALVLVGLITTAILTKKYELDLVSAAAKGDGVRVHQLLSSGADPNSTHPTDGDSALYFAVNSGNLSVVTALLMHGANPNIVGSSGPILNRALWFYALADKDSELARRKPYKEIIQVLIMGGANTATVKDPEDIALLKQVNAAKP